MTPKHIIFDLDGTLTDSGPGIMNCARQTFLHYGVPVPNDATLRTMVGPPLRESFPRFGIPMAQVDEAIAYYRSLYVVTGKYENAPYPGIERLLQNLHTDGHHLYVATSKPEHMAVDILEHFGLATYFDMICGSLMDGIRDKKELVIAWLFEQAHIDSNALMVGDTVFDVLGANAHHIPTIAVGWGYGDPLQMRQAGVIAVANTAEELYEYLSQ